MECPPVELKRRGVLIARISHRKPPLFVVGWDVPSGLRSSPRKNPGMTEAATPCVRPVRGGLAALTHL